jgi:type VI protein secretion system component VasK
MSTSTAGQDTINQLLQIADNSPMPIKTLLNNISATSWHYVLQEAGQFIQKHWQTDVMAIYNSQLANRFPFAADATDEVSLSQFGKFLGTQGILIRFFQTYLQPFADNTNKIWVWKIINNQHMPFSDLALNQIQHASKLQRMLFPNGDNQAMSLKNFSLSENLLT